MCVAVNFWHIKKAFNQTSRKLQEHMYLIRECALFSGRFGNDTFDVFIWSYLPLCPLIEDSQKATMQKMRLGVFRWTIKSYGDFTFFRPLVQNCSRSRHNLYQNEAWFVTNSIPEFLRKFFPLVFKLFMTLAHGHCFEIFTLTCPLWRSQVEIK